MVTHLVLRVGLAVLVLFVAGLAHGHAAAARSPKLVVVLVVDQMRGDYVDRYGHQWTRGLHRLVSGGALFRRAAYPYANTVTCAGHATISTGANPATHGIVANSWFDKVTWRSVACADGTADTSVSYGAPVTGGTGPGRLLIPTLADELRTQMPGPARVVTMSLKSRTAVMLAGRRAESVTWFNAAAKGLVTSSAYTTDPVPFVAAFVKANPIEGEFGTPWTRALPERAYVFEDDGVGEQPPVYWTPTFPHALNGSGRPEDAWAAWEGSPRSDAYLGRLATAAVDALKLGQGAGTDYLGISFTTLDHVGHDFGPASHEVQDVLVRLDETIGALLAHLDRRVGPGNYVVGLSADHGVAMIPERLLAAGVDAGRLRTTAVTRAAVAALQQVLGTAEYKVRLQGSDLHVEASVSEQLRANPQGADAVVRALRAVAGVGAVYYGESLAGRAASGDRDARAALASYRPGRSGDFVVYPRPNWFFVPDEAVAAPGSAASHGLPYAYDQHVPLVLYGAGIKTGEYLRPASPADIAPTLAFLCGITLPRADGDVLTEALLAGR